ncbi:Sec7 domain-containing protein [Kwoniella mangroviensis CBS 10435]|uniref:Sec7 domain-containing protein n=1 Tax=Kwoniella mangroviensis CBS 10435 TaxID=1331196 RepID=A0A1B9IJE9_9TREE|nr:Sec7 domain-containing protein [Kwoniella mangroviensis CBS 10435]
MSYSADLPPVTLLLQEVQTVTSAMRRNQRWASTSSSSYASSSSPSLRSHRLGRQGSVRSGSRRGARGSEGGVDEGDLMDGFVELRRTLSGVKDITALSPLDICAPFLALIRSPLTSGPITSLSLSSLNSIILSILPLYLTPPSLEITPLTPLQLSLTHITSALSQCRFPSSSPQQDELVLIKLLKVIDSLIAPIPVPTPTEGLKGIGNMLDHMGDESVCELLEVGLGMLARSRLGEGVRNSAQASVQGITRVCFVRLKVLRPEDVERLLGANEGVQPKKVINEESQEQVNEEKSPAEEKDQVGNVEPEKEKEIVESREGDTSKEEEKKAVEEKKEPADKIAVELTPSLFTPYGLPTILELLRVLIALLNPNDQAHTDSMRLSALAILNTALEVGGSSLGNWPELREGVRDEGCRYLFQLTRSDSPSLLAQSLRTTSTLFSTLLPQLKLQLELFLSYLIDRLTPPNPSPIPPHLLGRSDPPSRPGTPSLTGGSTDGRATPVNGEKPPIDSPAPSATPRPLSLLPPVPNETKELMLDTLTQIALRPSFMVDCWVNFDCSTESEDIFERLMTFLTRGVYPSGPPKGDGSTNLFDGLDNTQLLSLEILLSFVSTMAERLDGSEEPWSPDYTGYEILIEQKSRKGVLLTGASLFNQKPKTGLAILEKEGIISPEAGGEETEEDKKNLAIARFLRSSSRLDKKLVGEYISRPDQLGLLKAFIGLFDFKGKSIADAMRELLETFRLPGEAQPIARITETFAEHFFSFKPAEIVDQDAVYVLAYSVIMLNTDLHNPQNRKRMTIEDYKKNLRGVNGGKDFDPEYLASIHESIKKREIILPEEHAGQHGFEYAWKSLMQRSRTAGPMIICNTAVFDEAMFKLSWRPLISSFAYAFTTSAQDEHVIQKAITGFRQCASLAGHFRLLEVFDTIVQSLSSATGLLDETEDGYQMSNYPSVEKEGQTLTVSPLSIRFGQSYRSQLATVVLFTIANGNGSAIREGWLSIFEMFQTLFLHQLLPTPMLQMEDFLAGTTTIPMKASAPTPQPERRPEGGLLSTLSSYLLSPYGQSNEVLVMETSDEDVENTLVAVDCLSSCKLEELYAEILALNVEALLPALRAIRFLAESRTTAKLQARSEVRGETGSPVLVRFEGQLPYDPACVFHLEMMVSLASRSKENIAETWPIIFEYISSLLSSAQSYSVLLIERAVVGLLRLCLIVSEKPKLRDQLYIALDVLRSLPSTVLNSVSEQLMAGVARILEKDKSVVSSQTEWNLVIALFRATVAHPEASKVTLQIVQKMASSSGSSSAGESGPGLTNDNYSGTVALLDEFATAAGAAAANRSQQNRRSASRQNQNTSLGPTVERGLTALDSLYELRNVIPGLIAKSGLGEHEAFNTFWLPPLLVIGKQCINGCSQIRQRAIAYLQRLLLSTQLLSSNISAEILLIIFDKILFPVLDELLKSSQTAQSQTQYREMAETRLKACTLLCKIFLQYVIKLVEYGNPKVVEGLWVGVLDKLERFMRGERDLMNEASESLKNVVLVMHSSNLLVPPPATGTEDTRTPEQRELWDKSVERIERVLPGFLDEAIPPPTPAPASAVQTQQPSEGQA